MAHTIPPTRTLRILAIAVALVLGACGSDSDSSDITATGNTPVTSAVGSTEDSTSVSDTDAADAKGTDDTVEGVTRFWIKSELVDCVGEAPQRCMQVAESEDGEYLLFYDQIAGFEFVEGTSYVVDVQVDDVFDPPADASSLSYTLVEVISEN